MQAELHRLFVAFDTAYKNSLKIQLSDTIKQKDDERDDDGDDFLVHNAMLCLFQFQRFIRMGIGLQLACAAVDGSTGFQVVAVGGYL